MFFPSSFTHLIEIYHILEIVLIAISVPTFIWYVISSRRKMKMYKTIMEVYPDAMVITRAKDGILVDINDLGSKLIEYDRNDIVGKPTTQQGFSAWVDDRNRDEYVATLHAKGYASPKEYLFKTKTGKILNGEISGVIAKIGGERYTIASIRDVTERAEARKQIEHLAYFDSLTGLANRAQFKDFIQESLRHEEHIVIFFIDLDNFKLINDSYGHYFGDSLLKEFGSFLTNFVGIHSYSAPRRHLVSRLGGDEFTITICGNNNIELITSFAADLVHDSIKSRFVENVRVRNSISVGISLYPESGDDLLSLMKTADLAMYNAKWKGKNSFSFYNKTMISKITKFNRYAIIAQDMIEHGELSIAFQPLYSLISEEIRGAEALIRFPPTYEDEQLNIEEFIQVLEETGTIIPVTLLAIRKAIEEAHFIWKKVPDFKISINLSIRFFNEDVTVLDKVFEELEKAGAIMKNIHLELTESVFTQNFSRVKLFVEKAKKYGVMVDIDDFGKGFSSMEMISKLPSLDKMKIDKYFIMDIDADHRAFKILKSMIALGQNLDMYVCVEGVENGDQLRLLKTLGVDFVQGFYDDMKPMSREMILMKVPPQQQQVPRDDIHNENDMI